MKIGVSLPVFTNDVARPLEVAARARELELDGVFSPDHLFPPIFYPPSGPERPALEAFSVLSAVAAREPGLAVGTLVARVTLRAPGMLAKQGAALDAMSGGRAILALGTGDRASLPEHERYGIPFPGVADRIALLEETVSALKALFTGDPYEGGAHVPAMQGPLLPPGSPAVWVGGLSDPVVAVAARVADAWNGWGLDAASFSQKAARLREVAEGRSVAPTWGGIALVGRDDADLDRLRSAREDKGLSLDGVWVGTADQLRRFADELEAAGASWFIVLPAGPADRLGIIAEALRSR
jgi:alkanesulfonate monooxygenase SsuD/methylene tetrahydromethanopterin reductase-like flavin-dependent oxidoreductase (luciferase family)